MDQEEELGEYGLFHTEDPETPGPHLHFNQTWSPEAVDAWVRRLAPKLFTYMDARYGGLDNVVAQGLWRGSVTRRGHAPRRVARIARKARRPSGGRGVLQLLPKSLDRRSELRNSRNAQNRRKQFGICIKSTTRAQSLYD